MTIEHEASRTLVKSPPELWAECSDAASLARHIGEFGEITITRLEPESAVAWEGENVSGTVQIEPSGWGTRVTLTVQREGEEPQDAQAEEAQDAQAEEPQDTEADEAHHTQPIEEEADAPLEETVAESDPPVEADPGPVRRRWMRLIGRFRSRSEDPEALLPEELEPVAEEIPEDIGDPQPEPQPEPEPAAEPTPEPAPSAAAGEPAAEFDAEAILAAALDSLGQAHHRPFSRA